MRGGKTNGKRIGSQDGVDNLETGTNAFKLYEAWVEQNFYHDRVSVLLGLMDFNSEFYVNDMAGNFLRPTYGLGQTVAESSIAGPPAFPNSSLAARLKLVPFADTYVSFAVLDGVAGNPNHKHGTHIDLNDGDGAFLVAEAGYTPSETTKLAIGSWTYTAQRSDFTAVDANGVAVKRRQQGVYALTSYQFYADAKGRTLGAFADGGIASDDALQADWDYQVGVVAGGFVPTRAEGEFGLGYTQTHNGDNYMRSVSFGADRIESAVEFYYRDKLMDGIYLQPDVQYIHNPGTNTSTKDAMVYGLRTDITF